MILCRCLDRFITWKHRRWLALTIAILELILFSGYHYGYNALVPEYKNLGVFSQFSKKEQEEKFSTAFGVWLIVQTFLITGSGIIMDKFGLRTLKIISVLLFAAGTLMFAFTDKNNSNLFFAAGSLVAMGSTSTLICNHQISTMFTKFRGSAIALMSGAFDSSTILTFIISKTAPGISLKTSFLLVAFCSTIIGFFIALFILTQWNTDMALVPKPKDQDEKEVKKEKPSVEERMNSIINQRFPSLTRCFLSWPFVLVTLWFMFGLLRFTVFLSQLFTLLEFKFPGDQEKVNSMLKVFSALMMSGFVISPISGLVLDISRAEFRERVSYAMLDLRSSDNKLYWTHISSSAPAFLLTALSALTFSILTFIKSEVVLYIIFLFFVILRSLLFSAFVNFVLTAFPIKYFGTVFGGMNLIAGLLTLLDHALRKLDADTSKGLGVFLSSVLLITPLVLLLKCRLS